jgi:hypothetical protein
LLIKNALIDAGIIRDDQAVDTNMQTFALYRLNLLLKSYQAIGLHLWRTVETTLMLEDGKKDYTLGTGGDRHAQNLTTTTLGAAEAAAQTILTVASSANMTAGDVVGIELTAGTVDWTTIASVDDATTITVDVALTGAAASGNTVFSYTALAPQPLKIHEAYVVQKASTSNHTPVAIVSNNEYMNLANKDSESYPNQIQFRPELTTTELRVWPLSDNNTARLVMTVELPLEDMDSVANDLAMPAYWYEAIHCAMVYQMGKSYAAPREQVTMFQYDAEVAKAEAKAYGVENTHIQVVPEGYNFSG